MSHRDSNTVRFEDSSHFGYDSSSSCLYSVGVKKSSNVVGVYLVEIDEISCISPNTSEVLRGEVKEVAISDRDERRVESRSVKRQLTIPSAVRAGLSFSSFVTATGARTRVIFGTVEIDQGRKEEGIRARSQSSRLASIEYQLKNSLS